MAFDLLSITPGVPDYELVDIHTHPYNRAADGGMYYDEGPLEAVLPQHKIGMAVVMAEGTLDQQYERMSGLCRRLKWLVPAVWVWPREHDPADVEDLLKREGFRGLKLHPTVDGYDADSHLLDPFMEVAAKYRAPVQVHSAVDGPSRPERIAALAKRYPDVPVIMIHCELGALKKRAALETIRKVPNLYAETSWTNAASVIEAVSMLGSHRTLFGTDATVDGLQHFAKKSIPSIAGRYVYTIPAVVEGVREGLPPEDFANWARKTAIRLYRLAPTS